MMKKDRIFHVCTASVKMGRIQLNRANNIAPRIMNQMPPMPQATRAAARISENLAASPDSTKGSRYRDVVTKNTVKNVTLCSIDSPRMA